jgi:hypothetical protein
MKKQVKFEVFIEDEINWTKELNGLEELKKYLMECDDSLSYFNAETAYIFECNNLYSDYLKSYFDCEEIDVNPDDTQRQLKYFKSIKNDLISYDDFIKGKVDKNKFNNFETGLYDYIDFYGGEWKCKHLLVEGVDDERLSITDYHSAEGKLIKANAKLKAKITWLK